MQPHGENKRLETGLIWSFKEISVIISHPHVVINLNGFHKSGPSICLMIALCKKRVSIRAAELEIHERIIQSQFYELNQVILRSEKLNKIKYDLKCKVFIYQSITYCILIHTDLNCNSIFSVMKININLQTFSCFMCWFHHYIYIYIYIYIYVYTYTEQSYKCNTFVFAPFFMSWTQRAKTFSMDTKGLFPSNIVHKSV